jgi:hypothetical protein
MQFTTKNSHQIDVDNGKANKLLSKLNIKFLRIYADSTLSWKIHIEQNTNKLRAACYAVRYV